MKTVAGVFPSFSEAGHVARHLENLGIVHEDINIIAGNDQARHDDVMAKSKREHESTAASAASAASFGGGVGIVASLIALAIPGVGPIIAGGAMATVLTGLGIGAAAGGLLGAFGGMGISHDDAKIYEQAVREGKVFLSVHVDDSMEAEVIRVMNEHSAGNVHEETSSAAHPYPGDSSVRSYDYSRR